jgi:hypothetical protein
MVPWWSGMGRAGCRKMPSGVTKCTTCRPGGMRTRWAAKRWADLDGLATEAG